jgi:hypothetical protein
MVPRSQAEDSRYAAAVKGLGSELERQREERKQLQSQIDELVSVDAGDAADIGRSIATAEEIETDARRAFRTAVDGSQIYRLAANWYGVSTSDVNAGAVCDGAVGVLDLQRHCGRSRRQRRGPRLLRKKPGIWRRVLSR